MKYHILKGNTNYYEDLGFKFLLDEENENKNNENKEKRVDGVYWRLGNSRVYNINKGDICYIYYTNLPDFTDRIIFRAEVIDSDYDNGKKNAKSIYKDADSGDKYMLLRMRYIALEEKDKYSKETLKKKYNLEKINSMTSHLLFEEDNPDHERLIKDLESEDRSNHTLKGITNYFENYRACYFKCKSFIKDNGFTFVEKHHLIERNLIENNDHIKGLDKKINNELNLIPLCPLCHQKIHHISKEERRNMIKTIYTNSRKEQKELYTEIKNIVLNNNPIKTLDWLYFIYDCEDTKKVSFEFLCDRIYDKFNGYPDELLKLARTEKDFIAEVDSSIKNGNYIKLKNNMYINTNKRKSERNKILSTLKTIYRKRKK